MSGLRSCTSIDVPDLKVMKFLEQWLWRHTSGTSAYSHMYGDHDDLQNSRCSHNCGSRLRWTESRNFVARRLAAVVWSLSCAALRGVTRERERGVEEVGGQGYEGGGQVEEESIQGSWNCLCSSSPRPPLYSGEGVHLNLPQGSQGRRTRERQGRRRQLGGARLATPQTLAG
jgi:hypothetical protein